LIVLKRTNCVIDKIWRMQDLHDLEDNYMISDINAKSD